MDLFNISGCKNSGKLTSISRKRNGADSSKTGKVAKNTIILYLLCLYFVISLFGNVFRFTAVEGSFGVGSIVLCVIAVLTFKEAGTELFKRKLWFALFLLLAWCSFSSMGCLISD